MAFSGFSNAGTNSNGTTASYGGQYGPLAGQRQSGTSFSDPVAAQQLIQQILGGIQGSSGQLQQGLTNPTGTPQFQGQLGGLLAALRPQEKQQQQDLGDVFRGAGNMSSGIYGGAQAKLLGQQGLNEGQMTSDLMGKVTQQLIQALLPQILQGPQLMDAMKLQSSSAQNYRAPSTTSASSTESSAGNTSQPNAYDFLLRALGIGGNASSGDGSNGWQAQENAYQKANQNPYTNTGSTSTWFDPSGNYVSGSAPGGTPWSPPPTITDTFNNTNGF